MPKLKYAILSNFQTMCKGRNILDDFLVFFSIQNLDIHYSDRIQLCHTTHCQTNRHLIVSQSHEEKYCSRYKTKASSTLRSKLIFETMGGKSFLSASIASRFYISHDLCPFVHMSTKSLLHIARFVSFCSLSYCQYSNLI